MRAVKTACNSWFVLVFFVGGVTGTVADARSTEEDSRGPSTLSDVTWPVIEQAPVERPYWSRNLFVRIAGGQRYLITDWWVQEGRDLRWAAPVVASLAMASDGGARSGPDLRLQRSLSVTGTGREPLAETLTTLGDAKVAAAGLGASYLISRWTGSERGRRVTSLSAEALVNSAIYVGLLKRATRRTRPTGDGTGQFFVADPLQGQEPTSFPSGHASGACAVAAVISAEFRGRRWISWLAYGTAGLIATSRVSLDRHFPSDVIFGALIGGSIGRMVSERAYGDQPSERRSVPGAWHPVIGPSGDGAGIGWSHRW